MLAKRIVAALDIKKGRVVKGIQFKNLRDAGDPVELAKEYESAGIDELVFLDITASQENRNILLDLVKRVSREVFIPFTVGGGIKTVEGVRGLARNGADKVFMNTAAVENPDLVRKSADVLGRANLVVAIDGKKADGGWRVHTHGGTKPRSVSVVDWARRVEELGAGEILLTSMETDGTRTGFDLELTSAVADAVNIPVIASGGAGEPQHFEQAFRAGASAGLAASIFHYGDYSVAEVKNFLLERGTNVRREQGNY
ncbi:MAG: imidazole glycerol phosphate synthase subunit HisF [Candidatus Bipolaricaulota bacterium]|nr:imidazole glycerol phosphate synthase subunit HisF [Candidatus Bipolaricaulota bacterium]MBS3791394.1 imidazole glycerol phosphate synthase subunit HisF [Candidatus Bipolaricaulota bacterium]